MKKYVAYYRVSTIKQGQSGLGLEAQMAGVRKFAGVDLLTEFTDIESGKKRNRKGLLEAVNYCRRNNATLIAYKLDRLTRTLEGLIHLRESRICFTALDSLNDSPLILDIKTAVAADELRKVSERTRVALEAKKVRGAKLGKPENLTDECRAKGRAQLSENARANENNLRAAEYVQLKRRDVHGHGEKKGQPYTWQEIADTLNSRGFRTSRGKLFRTEQVRRLYHFKLSEHG